MTTPQQDNMATGQQDRRMWSRGPAVSRSRGLYSAFTLIELLTVLAIMALIAALAVPAIKNFGQSDAMTTADQQLMGDVARARQLAMSQRTTVYMVFVPAEFWNFMANKNTPAVTNMCDKQLTGYTFMAYGAVGDQPGNHQWHYLAPWQSLPEGTFIAPWKFPAIPPSGLNQPYMFRDPINSSRVFSVYGFDSTNDFFPFPAVTNSPESSLYLPYIAFNYMGQLTDDGVDVARRHEYIPLARGVIAPAVEAGTRTFQFSPPTVIERPAGNSTNAYNIIDIDPLTGRATLEEPKIK